VRHRRRLFESDPVAAESLRLATQSLVHRGPDEQHHWMRRMAASGSGTLGSRSLTCDWGAADSERRWPPAHCGQWRVLRLRTIRRELETRDINFARAPTARSPCTLRRNGSACLEHLPGNSRVPFGMRRKKPSSRRAIALASTAFLRACLKKRSTWPRRSKRYLPPACLRIGTRNRCFRIYSCAWIRTGVYSREFDRYQPVIILLPGRDRPS